MMSSESRLTLFGIMLWNGSSLPRKQNRLRLVSTQFRTEGRFKLFAELV